MGHTVSNETPLDAIAGIVKTASEAEPDESAGVDSGFVARIQTGLVVGLGAGDDQTKQLKLSACIGRLRSDLPCTPAGVLGFVLLPPVQSSLSLR